MTKEERLKKSSLISNVFDKGDHLRGRLIKVILLKRDRDAGSNRCAFIVRRHLFQGKAVYRNRIRRVLREGYRKTKTVFPDGYDIVILATGVKPLTKSTDIEKDIKAIVTKYTKKHNKGLS